MSATPSYNKSLVFQPLANATISGSLSDLKTTLSISHEFHSTTLTLAGVNGVSVSIDMGDTTTAGNKKTDLRLYTKFDVTAYSIGHLNSSCDIKYNFVNGEKYKIMMTYLLSNGSSSSSIYMFTYFSTPARLNDATFTFQDNVSSGGSIYVSGLTLVAPVGAVDTTSPLNVLFQFQQIEVVAGVSEDNDDIDNAYTQTHSYSSNGIYTLTANTLSNDAVYQIQATAAWAYGYTSFAASADKMYVLGSPEINTATALDIQNDGGNDGNSGPDSVDQVVLSVTLKTGEYNSYTPEKVEFIFSLASDANNTRVAVASIPAVSPSIIAGYPFSVNPSPTSFYTYNVKLNEITPDSGKLVNGVSYKIRAKVTLSTATSGNKERSSDPLVIMFTQNVAPIPSVVIDNTWGLVLTSLTESSSVARFNNSPLIGISGYFSKTAQFDTTNYHISRQLDTLNTQFLLHYKVGNGSWTSVTKAVLLQKQASESLEVCANRVRNATLVTSSDGDGKFNNVVGSVIGTSQEPLMFYIPQQQVGGVNAFSETDKVSVSVTIVDNSGIWSGTTTAGTSSNELYMINKINNYSYTTGTTSEPWNSVDSNGNLFLNIPLDWASLYANAVMVEYRYSNVEGTAYTTRLFGDSLVAHVDVDPSLGTTIYYNVTYFVTNLNIPSTSDQRSAGLTSSNSAVANYKFPTSSDYSVTSPVYKTFNNNSQADGDSIISFNLAFTATPYDRIDGVDVYFTSSGSSISKTRIGTYDISNGGGSKTIRLLPGNNNLNLYVMNTNDSVTNSSAIQWLNYDAAEISFVAFRDRRVTSTNCVYGDVNDTHSGDNAFGKTIWNVPVISKPSVDGAILLEGGVINSSTATKVKWTKNVTEPFTYTITMSKDGGSDSSVDTNHSNNEQVLVLDSVTSALYKVKITKNFLESSAQPEASLPDDVNFYSIKVDTLNMALQVTDPSGLTSVSLKWTDAFISGSSYASGGVVSSNFSTNITSQFVLYKKNDSESLVRLNPGSAIETLTAAYKTYTLPSDAIMGDMYKFYMYEAASIYYNVNSVFGARTSPVDVPLSPLSFSSTYAVSTIPDVTFFKTSLLSVEGSAPSIAMNLDARGDEIEGFSEILLFVTQDGTPSNPSGAQAIMMFPQPPNNANYDNKAGETDALSTPNLGRGETSTVTTLNFATLSGGIGSGNLNGTYTLKIGDSMSSLQLQNSSRKSGFRTSTMSLPAEANFLYGSSAPPLKVMAIAVTSRGLAIEQGEISAVIVNVSSAQVAEWVL